MYNSCTEYKPEFGNRSHMQFNVV